MYCNVVLSDITSIGLISVCNTKYLSLNSIIGLIHKQYNLDENEIQNIFVDHLGYDFIYTICFKG